MIAARVSIPSETGFVIRNIGVTLAFFLGLILSKKQLSMYPRKGAGVYLKSFVFLAAMPLVLFFMGNRIIMNCAGIGSDL
jgi:hypothetical protein